MRRASTLGQLTLLEDDEAHLRASYAVAFGTEATKALRDLFVSERRHECVGVAHALGPIRGGLAYSVILVGALLGAITGTVAASVIAMGLISLPVMTRYGYDPKVATGVIAASGTITQIIPPRL